MMSKSLKKQSTNKLKTNFSVIYIFDGTQAEEMNLPGVAHWFRCKPRRARTRNEIL